MQNTECGFLNSAKTPHYELKQNLCRVPSYCAFVCCTDNHTFYLYDHAVFIQYLIIHIIILKNVHICLFLSDFHFLPENLGFFFSVEIFRMRRQVQSIYVLCGKQGFCELMCAAASRCNSHAMPPVNRPTLKHLRAANLDSKMN